MLWVLHGLLRFLLIVWMIPYSWSKLNLTQMSRLDYSAALTTVGEKSPMGLLWTSPALGVLVVLLGGVLFWQGQPPRVESELVLPGVYRVVEDPAPAAARLADDPRRQSVAFGQWVYDGPEIPIPSYPVPGAAGLSVRLANGDLVTGTGRSATASSRPRCGR
ncbi:hypothetical protein [Pseudonocardia sp. NPDC046786]|uniref:hypothetical protein n=1 Tax=Pseudonocardia sp. NPDC046786 TaxID=3155471 RepID=UPI0033C904EA